MQRSPEGQARPVRERRRRVRGFGSRRGEEARRKRGPMIAERKYTNGQLIGRMLKLAWRYRAGAIKSLVLQVLLLTLALSGLSLAGLGLDVIHAGFNPEAEAPRWPMGFAPPADWGAFTLMLVVGGLILVIALLRFVLDAWSQMQVGRLVQDIVVGLRAEVYHKLERLSFRFFDEHEQGTIINRVTGDVQAVRAFIDQVLIQVLMMALSLTFFMVYMLSIHPWLTLWCLLTTPVMVVLTVAFSRIVRPAYVENRRLYDGAVRVLAENAQGVHVVKGFSLQGEEETKFAAANQRVKDQQQWIFWRVSVFGPLIGLLPQINLVVLLLVGGAYYMRGEIAFGAGLVVFAGLLQQFSGQVAGIAGVANTMQRSLTGAQRVFEVMDAEVEIESKPGAVRLEQGTRGRVVFEGVGFAYELRGGEGERAGDAAQNPSASAGVGAGGGAGGAGGVGPAVLEDVSFAAEPGQTIAIVGATGAGKSTLLSLIPRFYDPTAGRVMLDGTDLKDLELDDLRRSVGIVFQESFLFSHTVAENIAFGYPEASREQIERAAAVAQADEFIRELPEGYDTVLAEAGGNLSGGQRQRLAIARAVLLEPAVLLLDDPTAAIDPDTEHEILSAMDRAMAGRTTFVVAHRLSTLRRADLVLVLEKGRIVERGTHEELMAKPDGHYRRAADLQSADEESRRLLGMPVGIGQEGGEG
ncbi:MAG: ABC transporter ATP-binding protein [Planctomycetota bacterium]